MEITKVKGIIVNEKPYKESSKILNIITYEYGVIGVLAKGVKKLNNKYHNACSKLVYAEFQIKYKKDGLSSLICADIINYYDKIKTDLKAISYSSFICELAYQVRKQNNNDKILDLLIESLDKINEKFDAEVITNILELKYLSFLGISPNLSSCALCKSERILTVSVEKGGFICREHHTNEKIVKNKTLKILRMLYYVDIGKISKIDIKDDIKKEIDDFLNEYYDKYTGLYLKSKKFLKNIKNCYN